MKNDKNQKILSTPFTLVKGVDKVENSLYFSIKCNMIRLL